jgi:hypothetical protein
MRGLLNKLVIISHIQSAIASASPKLSTLSSTLSKHVQAFSQLLHVHRISPSWGTALIEIVRRKEYLKTFYSKATHMAEILAKFRMLEQKRRENFHNEIARYLPVGIIQGLDDTLPTSNIKISNTVDNLPDITLADIQSNISSTKRLDFEKTVTEIRKSFSDTKRGPITFDSLSKLQATMIRLIPLIGGITVDFDRILFKSGIILF